MENMSLVVAFAGGVLSFVSPCVLPLVPGYLSFISGVTVEELRERGGTPTLSNEARNQVVLAALVFVLGFSTVFVALGATASVLGQFINERLSLFGKIAGVILILFGLHTMGLLRIRWLYTEKRLQTTGRPTSLVGAFVVGLAFAFGWTPCIGPILATILTLAASTDTVGRGVVLLGVYSLGLGVPFLLTALAVNRFFAAFARVRRHFHALEIAAGVLMIAVGVMVFTGRFTMLAQWLTPYLPATF
ncbi:MAG: cytochrome c biogenesis protein CcdA [Luteitalea sp.]|nr:cytochrome c biogenesis protein CcdA [Luteitalea sp.]